MSEREKNKASDPGVCSQKDCCKPPVYRYTWPGKDEALICAEHAPKLQAVASTIGLHLQLIPVLYPLYPVGEG